MKKVLVDLVVKEVCQVNANCVLLVMAGDAPFPDVRPGQFAELRIDETPSVVLRRPISVHSFNAEKNEIGFLVQIVGDGTKWLGSLKAGDKVNTLLPLGNGFTMPADSGKRFLLVGGGVGAPHRFQIPMHEEHLVGFRLHRVQPIIGHQGIFFQ